MRWSGLFRATLAVALVAGCGGETEEPAPIPVGAIPAPVLKAAREAMRGAQIESAARGKVRGVETYTLKAKDSAGKSHTMEIARDGKVTRTE